MDAKGREARSPWSIPWAGWKSVLWRCWNEASNDNIGLIAAGVAFYGFLALVPLLGAVVLCYGLIADPETVLHDVRALSAVLPREIAGVIGNQLLGLVRKPDGEIGLGLLIALAFAMFGARNGAGAIIGALNIVYEEREKRNFLWVNLLALAITLGAVAAAAVAATAMTALAALDALLPFAPDTLVVIGTVVSHGLLTLVGAVGAAALYRFGPSRAQPRWGWISPGSLLAALLWLALTLGFGAYVRHIGRFDATYGALGTIVALLTWLYLSAYALLFGAELNAELEHQTAQDTTTGTPRPLGERRAWAADHVAE